MQKGKKQQLLNTVENLKRIHEMLEREKQQMNQNLLASFQQKAIAIGNAIEKSEGEGTEAVKLLEDYCEKLYEKSVESLEGSLVGESEEQMVFLLDKIKESIDNLPLTYEFVFMPYKYSMWDSLESIFLVAKKDTCCRCRVIPIPYYEIAKNSEPRYCYEGAEFSENIDIVDYKTYDLQVEKPDVIFIHNPYDACNYVTQIDPAFFSECLINHTDMLVYVPYYVAGSYDKSGSWFRTMAKWPGIRNAHKMIVQAKTQKDALIMAGVPKEELLLLGQPKFDKVVGLRKKDNLKSSQWAEIIKNKKVFFLNTSIEFLLGNTIGWFGVMNDIIESVLGQNEAVLLWRPHPLLEATMRSVQKEIYGKYLKLKEMLQSSERVIVDETKDVYEAMVLSDALISDYSSIIFQYIATKKPVYVINGHKSDKESAIVTCDYYESYLQEELPVREFIEMVMRGEDPKKEIRYKQMADSIVNLDGTAGEKVFYEIMGEIKK